MPRRAAQRRPDAPALAIAGEPAAAETDVESRRQAIVDAAAEIFHRKGYHATSIQDIAEAVGMLKGSLYYYISSKSDLLLEIITQVHEQAFRDLTGVLEADVPTEERLRLFIIHHTKYCTSHLTYMGVYLHEYKALEGRARTRVINMRDRYEAAVCDLIAAGQEDGSFRRDVDARLAAKLVLGMINWLYHWYSPRGPLTPPQIGNSIADLVLRGLLPAKPGHARGNPPARR